MVSKNGKVQMSLVIYSDNLPYIRPVKKQEG